MMKKIGNEFLGYEVIPKGFINDYEHDAIVITSYTFEEDISRKLDEIEYPKNRVIKFFGK